MHTGFHHEQRLYETPRVQGVSFVTFMCQGNTFLFPISLHSFTTAKMIMRRSLNYKVCDALLKQVAPHTNSVALQGGHAAGTIQSGGGQVVIGPAQLKI